MNNIEIALEETMYEMIFSDIPKTNYKIRRSFDRRMKKMIRSYLADNTCNFDREQNFTKILHEKTTADRLI